MLGFDFADPWLSLGFSFLVLDFFPFVASFGLGAGGAGISVVMASEGDGGPGNGPGGVEGAGKGEETGEAIAGLGAWPGIAGLGPSAGGGAPRAGPGVGGERLAGVGPGAIGGAICGLLICSFGFDPGAGGAMDGEGAPGVGREGLGGAGICGVAIRLFFRSIFFDQVRQFFLRGVFKIFTLNREVFDCFQKSLSHTVMSFLRSTNNRELICSRHSFMPILAIQTNAKQVSHDLGILKRDLRIEGSIVHTK